jgi:hypothetical protein
LHEERERRKELQRQLAQTAERQRIMEERFGQIQYAIHQQNAPKAPEYETDPLGNTKFELTQTQEQLRQIQEVQQREFQERHVYAQQQQYTQAVVGAVNGAEAEFARENPDYQEAVSHYKRMRHEQVKALGYDPNTAWQIVQNEAFQVAEIALRSERSPAEVAFEIAKASGWKKGSKAPENVQKMESLQKGTKAAQSLGSGGTPTGKLTVDAVASMSEDEFDDFMKSGGWSKLG